jgi:hypothetical protein
MKAPGYFFAGIFAVLMAVLIPAGCRTVPAPPPANVKSAPLLDAAALEFKGKIEAQTLSAVFAANTLPDGNQKAAILGSLGIVTKLTAGTATQQQKDEAMAPVALALAGKLAEAQAGWAKASAEADVLTAKIKTLTDQIAAERVAAATELQRQLKDANDKAQRDADAKERSIISCVFYGGGFIMGCGAIICAIYAPTVPQLGPKAAMTLGVGAAASIGTAIAVNRLLSHPEVIWWGMGIIAVCCAAAFALIYSNHQHEMAAQAAAPVAKP